MRIEPPLEKVSGDTRFPGWLFLFILLIFGTIIYLLVLRPAPAAVDFKVLESQNTKIYRHNKNLWITLKSGDSFGAGDILQSWPGSSARLQAGQAEVFMEENTGLRLQKPGLFDRDHAFVLLLERGRLRVTVKDQKIKVIIPRNAKSSPAANGLRSLFPRLSAEFENADVLFTFLPEYSRHEISVAEGSVRLKDLLPWKRLEVLKDQIMQWQGKDAEKEAHAPEAPAPAAKAAPNDPAPDSAELLYDLSKGIPYSTKSGKAIQTFGIEPEAGSAFVELAYDVLQPSALAGISFPAEEIEISRFRKLMIQFQKIRGRGFPESFRIEFKSGDQVIRVFTGMLKAEESWQSFSFPLRFQAAAKISEISLLFSNGKVGEAKEGSVRIKKLSLG